MVFLIVLLQTMEKVIGIEMCSEAIQDAKVNAEKNGGCLLVISA